jgi:hypothetical protein
VSQSLLRWHKGDLHAWPWSLSTAQTLFRSLSDSKASEELMEGMLSGPMGVDDAVQQPL